MRKERRKEHLIFFLGQELVLLRDIAFPKRLRSLQLQISDLLQVPASQDGAKHAVTEQFQHLAFEEDQKSADDQETSDEAGTVL